MTSTEIRDMLLGDSDVTCMCPECGRPAPLYRSTDREQVQSVLTRQLYDGQSVERKCAPCWRSIAAKQSAPRPSRPVHWHRQKQLLTGLDCAPGQGDLFDTNGSK